MYIYVDEAVLQTHINLDVTMCSMVTYRYKFIGSEFRKSYKSAYYQKRDKTEKVN